jgi:hypothetical protein
MKLEDRIATSIRGRTGHVFLRRDFAHLGSPSQLSVALKALQVKGVIKRLGSGVYARLIKDPITGKTAVALDDVALAAEVFRRLGIPVEVDITDVDASAAQAGVVVSGSASASANRVTVSTGPRHRLSRKLDIASHSVVYAGLPKAPFGRIARHPLARHPPAQKTVASQYPPITATARRVMALVDHHKIAYVQTPRDRWADDVTRLAGDTVEQDPVADLLQALKQAGKVSGREMAQMLVDHLREEKRVRSIR